MKMVDVALGIMPDSYKDLAKVEPPSMRDLYEITRNNATANQCHKHGIYSGLSTEQTLILIVQGVVKDNETLIDKIVKLAAESK